MDLPAQDPNPVAADVARPAMPAASVNAASAPASGHGMPSFSSPFTLDTLLARCTQVEWKPDAKTMLFFNQEENALGAEQFRTLRSRLYQMREKTVAQENPGHERSAEGREVLRGGEPGAGAGPPAWTARAADRRRSARARACTRRWARPLRPGSRTTCSARATSSRSCSAGPMENLFFIPCGTDSRASGRTDRQRPHEDADAARGNTV